MVIRKREAPGCQLGIRNVIIKQIENFPPIVVTDEICEAER